MAGRGEQARTVIDFKSTNLSSSPLGQRSNVDALLVGGQTPESYLNDDKYARRPAQP